MPQQAIVFVKLKHSTVEQLTSVSQKILTFPGVDSVYVILGSEWHFVVHVSAEPQNIGKLVKKNILLLDEVKQTRTTLVDVALIKGD